jgi:hypothetical protein
MAPAFRPLLMVLAALAVWLVAWPAVAAAPICDSRGASALAPAPTLDTPDASIDVSKGPDACVDMLERDDGFHQGRAPKPLPSSASADLLPVAGNARMAPPSVTFHPVERDTRRCKSMVRDRLERPPRRPRHDGGVSLR